MVDSLRSYTEFAAKKWGRQVNASISAGDLLDLLDAHEAARAEDAARLAEVLSDHTAENDALREAAAIGWDAAVAALEYEDGTPVEVVRMVNPYRVIPPGRGPALDAVQDTEPTEEGRA